MLSQSLNIAFSFCVESIFYIHKFLVKLCGELNIWWFLSILIPASTLTVFCAYRNVKASRETREIFTRKDPVFNSATDQVFLNDKTQKG